jgi:hypothetical protein
MRTPGLDLSHYVISRPLCRYSCAHGFVSNTHPCPHAPSSLLAMALVTRSGLFFGPFSWENSQSIVDNHALVLGHARLPKRLCVVSWVKRDALIWWSQILDPKIPDALSYGTNASPASHKPNNKDVSREGHDSSLAPKPCMAAKSDGWASWFSGHHIGPCATCSISPPRQFSTLIITPPNRVWIFPLSYFPEACTYQTVNHWIRGPIARSQ